MGFPQYPKYKPTGVEWLGKVPDHWSIMEARRLFTQKRDPFQIGDEQLSATQKYGVIPQSHFMEMEDQKVTLALSGLTGFKHVNRDDFVISLRSFQGGIERSEYFGCVSPAYTVLRPSGVVNPGFWKHLLKSKGFVEALQSLTEGIRDGKTITYEQFGKISVPVFSIGEQQTIASFLDHETAKIDALIAEQQRLIELLKEKRQAVISHAVTKGLNPQVRMKDSGVEWLGEVPEHWEVMSFRNFADVVRGASPRPAGDPLLFNGDFMPWVTVAEITKDNQKYLNETGAFLTELGAQGSRTFQPNTLIYSNSGATLGVPKILKIQACANDGVIGFLNLSDQANISFLYFFLHSITEPIREKVKQGSGQPNLNTDIVKALKCPIPPINEQEMIVKHVEGICSKFDYLETICLDTIALLQERRTALISAAVTGQIDVRGFQPVAA